MGIPLLDLKAQYQTIKPEIDEAVAKVLESAHFIFGPESKVLEKEIAAYCGAKEGVGVGNGTDALVLTLRAMGVGPGDEVITSPFTFFASAETVAAVGATPVFVDIDPFTLNMDLNQLESKITPRTKAIIPVHIFGQMVDVEKVMEIAARHDLKVIEDSAQAIGAQYKGYRAGAKSDAATFSFFPTKNLGGYGDGGMVVTQDEHLADEIRVLRFHGCRTKYYHDEIGYNSRLDELQAAILRVKLRYLDEWNEQRRQKAVYYDQLLAGQGLTLPVVDKEGIPVYHLYVVRSPERENMMAKLKAHDIGTAVYYPVPLHLQRAFQDLGYKEGDFPQAENACREAFALPCFPELTSGQQEEIVKVLLGA